MGLFDNFDADELLDQDGNLNDDTGFTPIPEGTYVLILTEIEQKETNAGGERLACTFEVAEGQYQGRKIFESFNTTHAKAKVQEIGHKQVMKLFYAGGGQGMPSDLEEFRDLGPVQAKVKVEQHWEDADKMINTIDGRSYAKPTVGAVEESSGQGLFGS